jgi:hypothetical protein
VAYYAKRQRRSTTRMRPGPQACRRWSPDSLRSTASRTRSPHPSRPPRYCPGAVVHGLSAPARDRPRCDRFIFAQESRLWICTSTDGADQWEVLGTAGKFAAGGARDDTGGKQLHIGHRSACRREIAARTGACSTRPTSTARFRRRQPTAHPYRRPRQRIAHLPAPRTPRRP